MPRDTLLDFFEDFSAVDQPFIVHDDGYRVRETSYRTIAAAARHFAGALTAAGIGPDDRIVIWSENRTEWIVALWGCLLARVVVVPIDFRSSADLVTRIATIVSAKAVLTGEEVPALEKVDTAIWRLTERVAIDGPFGPAAPLPASVTPATLAEILFTSGATADPKGVTITHRNVLANIVPIEREVKKYLRYERPFHPIRFLNLLPLSHMFGQSMATFVPPMLQGTVVFSHGFSPVEILRQIKSRRVSVLVCVPKVLEVLREHVERVGPETAEADALAGRHFLWRWWRYRRVHRLFGWKFWCVICGAAPLEAGLEAFWRKLGFLVVQGYGLTETAPIVTLNHPFHASTGTVGTPIGGVQVRIAADGEILVRGDNVTTGYFDPRGGPAVAPPEHEGWFQTGDIGEIDERGRLLVKGRKKEMIATAQGQKVFPEDVERALLAQPGVVDAAVVGVVVDGDERVHAALVLEPGVSIDAIVKAANAALEDHQRVWRAAIRPHRTLPRTEGTEKLKRHEIRRWFQGGTREASATGPADLTVESVVARFTPGRTVQAGTSLDELGLSSLVRIELMMALEDAFRVTLDESAMAGARTVADLQALVAAGGSASRPAGPAGPDQAPASRVDAARDGPIDFPAWNRWRMVWLLRRLSLPTWILPLGRLFMSLTVDGLDQLATARGPVIFAANHQSHLDTPAILLAMPRRRRYWVAPAMAKEFFRAHFNRREFGWRAWFTNSLNYYLACCFFNTFPLPQREAGTRQTLRYIGEITADGYSILIFPEGRRTQTGAIDQFRPGVGMIASRLGLPVVPVRIEGLDKVLHQSMRWPKRGPVRVAFGAPLHFTGDDYQQHAAQVERAVQRLGAGGSPPTGVRGSV